MYSGVMFTFKGILAIVFGLLLIIVPDFMQGTFLTLFTVLLIIACIVSFLFAVTSRQTDTMFWFLLSGGIVILLILRFFIPIIFAAVFAVAIAGWALVTGAWDLDKYICSKRRFYAIMACLLIASLAIIALALYRIPVLRATFLTTICGIFAVIFGIFSLALGIMILRGRIPSCLMPASQKP